MEDPANTEHVIIECDSQTQAARALTESSVRLENTLNRIAEQAQAEISPPASDRSTRTVWCSRPRGVDPRLARFVVQAAISLLVVVLAIVRLTTSIDDKSIWLSLLTFIVGLWSPSARLEKRG